MNDDRRAFLKLFGGAAVVGIPVLFTREVPPDEFDYRGYRVKWAGWREPANLAIVFGLWFAVHRHDHRDGSIFGATTLGVANKYREMDCIDCTRLPDWPVITPFSSVKERADVKERARLALLACIDGKVSA